MVAKAGGTVAAADALLGTGLRLHGRGTDAQQGQHTHGAKLH